MDKKTEDLIEQLESFEDTKFTGSIRNLFENGKLLQIYVTRKGEGEKKLEVFFMDEILKASKELVGVCENEQKK